MTKLYDELLVLGSEAEYKSYYIREYCNQEIYTHDGIRVKFRPERFEHAFFESKSRKRSDKSIFSWKRAERISWIKKVLTDKELTIYAGWDKKRKKYDHSRRVCLVTPDGYVVVVRYQNPHTAIFVTAFVIDDPIVENRIKSSPVVWTPTILKK
ncbi:hypothetical protein [Caldifermentibacillus hisashii]|uniref:hypothetical protein n=1 Tax=Caldifermentibacillus hisashii TaxID=996558 RepID=UPI0031014B4A